MRYLIPVRISPGFVFLSVSLALAAIGDDVGQSATMALSDHLHEFTLWAARHPALAGRKVQLPSIDLDDELGRPVYHGDTSAGNARFLEKYPPVADDLRTDPNKPTLAESLSMVPAFKNSIAATTATRHTLIAITVAGCEKCKVQDEAIVRLRQRSQQLGIRIFDLTLQP